MIYEHWFEIDEYDENTYSRKSDSDIIQKFCFKLKDGLGNFIDPEKSNFFKLVNDDKEYTLIRKTYEEAVYNLKSSSQMGINSFRYYGNLKNAGLTGASLRAKLHLLKKQWKKVTDFLTDAGLRIFDFVNDDLVKLLRKFLSYLNSFLGSLLKAIPGVESMKEFKDLVEGYMGLYQTE